MGQGKTVHKCFTFMNFPREGVIIEWPLKRLFKDARDVIITSHELSTSIITPHLGILRWYETWEYIEMREACQLLH